jgi:hypothetical protein
MEFKKLKTSVWKVEVRKLMMKRRQECERVAKCLEVVQYLVTYQHFLVGMPESFDRYISLGTETFLFRFV